MTAPTPDPDPASRHRPVVPDAGRVASVATAREARVVLLGKPGCHLCDVARDVVARVCATLAESWVERSTLDDVHWEMAYWEHIPVLFVDGREISHWFVREEDLRAALRG